MTNPLTGRRRDPLPFGERPEDGQPGDYWLYLNRVTGEPMDAQGYHPSASNLTGTVWGVIDPNGNWGLLAVHTVREHEDGTISVLPGDGSSNSIKISSPTPDGQPEWHGYIRHGVWQLV